MNKKTVNLIILFLISIFPLSSSIRTSPPDNLVILWTTAEKDVFQKIIYPYALNSKKSQWWRSVKVIVWGPSAKSVAVNSQFREALEKLRSAGVELEACKWCSDSYKVSDKLSKMGFTVKYMGKPLTEYLKKGHKILTF